MNLKQPNIRLKQLYPRRAWPQVQPMNIPSEAVNDERVGFLLPFITGAVVSAPLWYVAGNNKAQQNMTYQPPYYTQPYPVYYPYQSTPYPYVATK